MQNPFEWQIPLELHGGDTPLQLCFSIVCAWAAITRKIPRRKAKNKYFFRLRSFNIIIFIL